MSNQEITLTDEQIAQLDKYKDKWYKNSLDTSPIDKEKAEKAILELYDCINEPRPKKGVVFCDGPREALKIAKENGAENPSVYDFIYGQLESGMGAFFDFFKNETDVPEAQDSQPIIDFAKYCGWTLMYDEMAIVCDRMKTIKIDDQYRLHSLEGPAVEFRDGTFMCYVRNIFVEDYIIMDPQKITVQDIENEENLEIRRIKMGQYGEARYLLDSGAKLVNKDDFGELYRKEIPDDEPLMMVKVVNSTQEPDGTFKDYFIRVDPNAYGGLKTARAAIASTWRNEDGSLMFEDPNDYCDQIVSET